LLGGGVTIAGGNTQVQYNNSGALGASSNFVFDVSNTRLGVGTSAPTYNLDVSGTGQLGNVILSNYTVSNVLTETIVRNNTTFSPTQISGIRLWLDASDATTLTLSGSNVTQWRDKSGLGFHAIGAGNPVYNAASNRIQFNGSSSYFSNLSYSLTLASRSIFFVMSSDVTTNFVAGIFPQIPNPTSQNDYLSTTGLSIEVTGGNVGFIGSNQYAGVISNSPVPPLGIYNDNMNGRQGSTYFNGSNTTNATANYDAGTAIGYALGARWSSGISANYLNGYIYEVIVFNRPVSTSERQQIEGYLAWKWGLQSSLQSNHPYKSQAPPLGFNPFNVGTLTSDASFNFVTTATNNLVFNPTSNVNFCNKILSNAGRIYDVSGSANAPAYTFTADLSTGIHLAGTSQLAFDTSGIQRMVIRNSNVGIGVANPGVALEVAGDISANTYNGPGGTANAPHYTFSDDRTTGVFFPSTGVVGVTASGVERARFDPSGLSIGTGRSAAYNLDVSGTGQIGNVILSNSSLSNVYNAFVVRNNSTLTPTDISGLQVWIDAADATTVTGTTNITALRDKASNTVFSNATGFQYITGTYPSFSNSTRVDGRHLGSNTSLSLTQPITMVAVASFVNSAGYPFMFDGMSDTNRIWYLMNQTDQPEIGTGNGFLDGTTIPQNTTAVHTAIVNSSNSSIFINGTLNVTGNPGTGNTTGVILGSRFSLTYPWTGKIHEILIYNGSLSTTDRQRAEGYLAWKWGTQSSLPSNHPYKTSAPPGSISLLSNVGSLTSDSSFNFVTTATNNLVFNPTSNVDLCNKTLSNAGRIFDISGSSNAPSYTFINDASSGLHSTGTGVGVDSSGILVANFDASSVQLLRPTQWRQITQDVCGTSLSVGASSYSTYYYISNTGFNSLTLPSLTSNDRGVQWTFQNTTASNLSIAITYLGGAGITSPLSLLSSNNTTIVWTGTTYKQFASGGAAVAGSNTQVQYNASGSLGASSNFVYDASNIRLGVATTAPAYTLDISGSGQIGNVILSNYTLSNVYAETIVRNTAPLNPSSISNLALWLDAADTATITTSSGYVTQWNDKSGNSRHASNVGTGVVSGGTTLNGRNTINFANGSYLRTPSFTMDTITRTVFVVYKFTSNSYPTDNIFYGQSFFLGNGTPATGTVQFVLIRESTSPYNWYGSLGMQNIGWFPQGGGVYPGAAGPTNQGLMLAIQRSAAQTGIVSYTGSNSAVVAFNGSNPFQATEALRIGVDMYNSQIAEMIYYNSALTYSQFQQIEGYLAWKWGLQGSLPADHPYKAAGPVGTGTSFSNVGTLTADGTYNFLATATNDLVFNPTSNVNLCNKTLSNAGRILDISGSANAPAYTFTADASTGLFFAGNSTAAITAAGIERLRVDPSGLSIGTGTRAQYNLDVSGSGQIGGVILSNYGLSNVCNATIVRSAGAGPFSPTQISGLSVWIDASDASTVTGTTNVTAVREKASNRVFSNASGFSYANGAFSNATQDSSRHLGSNTSVVIQQPLTFLAVASYATNNAFQLFFDSVDGATNRVGTGMDNSNRIEMFTTSTFFNTGATSIPINTTSLRGGIANTSNSSLFYNGTQAATGTLGSGYINGLILGARFSTNLQWTGTINEILIYSGALSTSDRQQAEGYLAWKWGTQSSLPSDHPYKSSAPTGNAFNPSNAGTITTDACFNVLMTTSNNLVFNPTSNVNLCNKILSNAGRIYDVSGSANAPAYTFTSDVSTGLFYPTTSTLGVTTGGLERLRVNASGNVGIGTIAPAGILDVSAAISAPIYFRVPVYSRLVVQDISAVNTVTVTTANSGLHYNITTSSFSNITLPVSTTTNEGGAFWVFRNNAGVTLNVGVTNNANLGSNVYIPADNALTIAVSSNASNTFTLL